MSRWHRERDERQERDDARKASRAAHEAAMQTPEGRKAIKRSNFFVIGCMLPLILIGIGAIVIWAINNPQGLQR